MKTNRNSYDLVKDLEFERIGGTSDEHKAADIIVKHLENLNVEFSIEEFKVNKPIVKNVLFKVLKPYVKEYIATMYMMGASATENGITKEFLYVENASDVLLQDAKDKIVMVNGIVTYDIYKKLVAAKVAGFVGFSGTLYDKEEETDLEERMLRPRHYDLGKIPGVCIRINDAEEIVYNKVTEVQIICQEEFEEGISKNVIATLNGSDKSEEVIVFTAHYDSVRFSKGSYDNATGSASILGLLEYFIENKPKRTLKFIWCGSEEMGLLGSKDYVFKHKEELENIKFCFNVDMTGVILGYDICVCTSLMSLVNYIDGFAKEVGHSLNVRQDVYSSDSTPFANEGIPAISFARIVPRGGKVIHSNKDDMSNLSFDAYNKTLDFMKLFADKLVNAHTFFVERKMPDEMIKKLNEYLGTTENKI